MSMNTKRSYLENLNAGRQRRTGSALEEISRTLDQLETRLERALEPREQRNEGDSDIARRIERLSDRAGMRRMPAERSAAAIYEPSARTNLERIAREIENSRRQEDQLASIGGIAAELKAMREEIRGAMGSGLKREFDMLRQEFARAMADTPKTISAGELNAEFERLSDAIERLADRSDDKNTKMLRLEMQQVKSALANLAREETVRSLDRRWDAFEDQISNLQHASDPALERLAARLEEISSAVNSLPESLSLHSLEERVRSLASALDQFAGQHDRNQPDLYTMVEERLDEISRAITASAALARSPGFDVSHLERIEARITSLANQLDEVVRDRAGGLVVERLNALSERVDEIGKRMDVPQKALERLAMHMARIAEKLETAPRQNDADEMFRSLEDRFAHLSTLIERRQEDALLHGQALFHDLERRIEDIAERLSRPANGGADIVDIIESRFAELAARLDSSRQEADDAAWQALEARLDDISGRLHNSVSANAEIDPEVIRNLEAQVASLAAHLARPSAEMPDFEDIAPRLEKIELSISEHRAAVLEAARRAAEEAVQKLSAAEIGQADSSLRLELKNLEALTRKSDERNAKTFEAIHDTLLKIVDRLGSLEEAGAEKLASGFRKDDEADAVPPLTLKRTPTEAAVAAAEAALIDDMAKPAKQEPRKMLAGLSRAFSARRNEPENKEREEPVLGDGDVEDDGAFLDTEHMNEPLEPGSGAPDLNAILRRVREQQMPREQAAENTAKADFIAAARRAAQAAAAEAQLAKQADGSSEKGAKRGISGILGRKRKQLLLTLGAAVVVAGGVYYAKTQLQNTIGSPQLTSAESPADEARKLVKAASTHAEKNAAPAKQPETANADKRPSSAPKPQSLAPTSLPSNASAKQDADKKAAGAIGEQVQVPAVTPERTGSVTPSQSPASPQPFPQSQQPEDTPQAALPELPDIPEEIGPDSLRQAAGEGKAEAFFEIANRYAEGRGVPADNAKAARWYELAAEQGLAPAQYRMGNLYEKGLGVERDIGKAKMWYQLAAGQGNASAMHNLGVLFAMGADGTPDNTSAARWFQKAAELGVTDSQFNLGILSAKGAGVPRDLVEAYKWFDIVARTGDQDAAAKRDEIAKSMSPTDLTAAQGKVKLWTARKMDPIANTVDIPRDWVDDEEITTASVDMKKAIVNVQLILNKNGFDAGPPDGIMGEKTRAAIRAFQQANGLAETGEIDDALVRALLKSNEGDR